MSSSEDHNWEEHWREEVDQYTPLPNTTDWADMHQLLDGASAPQGQRGIDQESTTNASPYWQAIGRLSWYQWILIVAAVVSVGYWLSIPLSEQISEAEGEAGLSSDSIPEITFAPNFSVNEYWTFDKDGNRSAVPQRDTSYYTQRVVRRAPRNLPATADQAQRVYIDTVYFLHPNGSFSIRYDTVYGNNRSVRQSPLKGRTTHDHTEQPQPSEGTAAGTSSLAKSTPIAPAAAPSASPGQEKNTKQTHRPVSPATGKRSGGGVYRPSRSSRRNTNPSISLGVVAPLPAWQPAPGTTYWERRVQELFESGRLKVKRIRLENGHFPPINQRF